MLRALLSPIAVLFLALAATAAHADDAGKVVSLEGTVEIGRAGSFAAAASGGVVQTGDTIRTGKPGRARILFIDESVLNVGDNSTLVIDQTVFDPNKGTANTLIHLLGGKVRALVSEYYTGGTASYQIETTTAVSGVRGTEFVMTYDEKTKTSEVLGAGGTVAVNSTMDRKKRGVLIHTNEITVVEKGKFPTAPRQITTDDEHYREMMDGLDLRLTTAESLLLDDPAFGGTDVPKPDTADTNVEGRTTGDEGGENIPGGQLPPSEPGHTGGDLLGQPQPVLEAPTDVDVHF